MPSFLGLDILSESPSVVRNADMIPNIRGVCKRELIFFYFFLKVRFCPRRIWMRRRVVSAKPNKTWGFMNGLPLRPANGTMRVSSWTSIEREWRQHEKKKFSGRFAVGGRLV